MSYSPPTVYQNKQSFGEGGTSQFHERFIVCVNGKQLVCSQILSVSHHCHSSKNNII